MGGPFLSEPGALRRKLERLKSAAMRRPDAVALEALAETRFRLALLPQTPGVEAIRYLQEARRVDGANPRYAYHLARFSFLYGDLEGAKRWLQEAVRLCPTSHRLWAHVGLLHHELQGGYKGKTEFEPDGLRLRAEAITKAIRKGEDVFSADLIEFVPPKSRAVIEEEARKQGEVSTPKQELPTPAGRNAIVPLAKRLENPNTCRWTGVIDLEIERLLEGAPSLRVRDRLLPLLDEVIARDKGRGNTTGFVLIAVQWLVAGYPAATIRRLVPQAEGVENDPPMALLDLVCSLFEAPPDALPAALARAIEDRKMPPLLGALIHQRRVLWRSPDFAASGPYCIANRLLADPHPSAEKAAALINQLVEAAKKIDVSPPDPLPDAEPSDPAMDGDPLAPEAVASDLCAIEARVKQMARIDLDTLTFLKQSVDPGKQEIASEGDYARIRGDFEASSALSKLLAAVAEANLNRLNALQQRFAGLDTEKLDAAVAGDRSPDLRRNAFSILLEACKNGLNELKNSKFKLVLDRIGKRLNSASQRGSTTALTPSERLIELTNELESLRPAVSEARASSPIVPATQGSSKEGDQGLFPQTPTGLDGLGKVLAVIDSELEGVLRENLASFDNYRAATPRLVPFRTLERAVLMDAARAFYRMDRRAKARSLWQQSLSLDPLNLSVLQNIAVCDTILGQDHSRTLRSWKACSEVLYFHAIAGGDPRLAAAERADFHRKFASAFSCGAVREGKEPQDAQIDRTQNFDTLLNTPGKLAEFVEHKCAEFLNRRFEIGTATLLLGVKRTGKQDARDEGKKRIEAFLQGVSADLPERVAAPFAKIGSAHLDRALADCADPGNLTEARNPRYKEDEAKLIRLITDACELKTQMLRHLLADREGAGAWEKEVKSLEFFSILERLDSLPLAQDVDIVRAAVSGIARANNKTPDNLLEMLDGCLDSAFGKLVQAISVDEDRELLERLAKTLMKQSVFWRRFLRRIKQRDVALFVDGGHLLFPQEVKDVLTGSKRDPAAIDQAISALALCCSSFPALTGPAHTLGVLLSRVERHGEAVPYLEGAIRDGVVEEGVAKCKDLLSQVRAGAAMKEYLKRKDFAGARRAVLEEIKKEPENLGHVHMLIGIYKQWIDEKPHDSAVIVEGLLKDIPVLLETAEKAFTAPEPTEETQEAMRVIRSNQRILVVNAAVGAVGKLDSLEKFERLRPVFDKIVTADPENVGAVHLLAVCLYQTGGGQIREEGQRSEGKRNLQRARELAERVVAHPDAQGGMKAELRKMMTQIDEVLRVI